MFERETAARLRLLAEPGLEQARAIREVHSLKGASASVCATLLSGRAAALEARLKRGEPLGDADVTPLTEAFDAWSAAMHTTEALSLIHI